MNTQDHYTKKVMKIEILKDTPFDKQGAVLPLWEFRLKYGYICSDLVADHELVYYLEDLSRKKPYDNSPAEWFKVLKT